MFALVLGLAVVAAPVSCYTLSHVDVSTGFRDCTFRKYSDTGVLWVTGEAEFIGDGVVKGQDGVIGPETFQYSVRPGDAATRAALRSIPPGSRVRVHYTKRLARWAPHGESSYWVDRVEGIP